MNDLLTKSSLRSGHKTRKPQFYYSQEIVHACTDDKCSMNENSTTFELGSVVEKFQKFWFIFQCHEKNEFSNGINDLGSL